MKPLKDYSFIRGVNHHMGEKEKLIRELSFAKKIGLNSIRFWLNYKEYENDPEDFLKKITDFVRLCYGQGFTSVPIIFNGNGIDPAILEEDFYEFGDRYCREVVCALKDEPGLLMYDVMNEPPCNDLILQAGSQEEKDEQYARIWRFVRHYCAVVKKTDDVNAMTVGNWLAEDLESTADLVDVLSYHDYSATAAGINKTAELALSVSRKYGKPVINNECCCVCRANPYDREIQVLNDHGIPWYVFNLMIDGYWSDVHGIFYPNGTVRDPSIIAAMMGCYRNRDTDMIVPEKPNREQFVRKAVDKAVRYLEDSTPDAFAYKESSCAEMLELCDEMANLLEAGQMTAMRIPPTAKVEALRKNGAGKPEDIRRLMYDFAGQLKKECLIL